jgi:hypothetical protein
MYRWAASGLSSSSVGLQVLFTCCQLQNEIIIIIIIIIVSIVIIIIQNYTIIFTITYHYINNKSLNWIELNYIIITNFIELLLLLLLLLQL